jgi:nucleoside-diphosphate-sugar epimerase
LYRLEDIKSHKNLTIIDGNLRDKAVVETLVKNQQYIFHFAWQTDLKKSMAQPLADVEEDLGGLLTLLEACRTHNPDVKIIFTSAVTVIGDASKLPSNEEEKEFPLSIYEANKLAAEKYLHLYYKNYGLKNCVLRLSNVFGEYQKIDNPNRGVLNFMIGRALRTEPLTVYGDGEFIRDYCYIQNYIDAFMLAAETPSTNGEVFVLGSGEGRTMNDVVQAIKKIVESLTDKQVEIKHIPFPEGTHQINKRNFYADISKFQQATGWIPKINFEEGLQRTVEFYVKQMQ